MKKIVPTAIFVITAALFMSTVTFDFIRSWDDGALLLFNGNLVGRDVTWVWRTYYFGHWIPLTWLTHMWDAHVWGLWAGGWHAENLLLHAGSTVMLYFIALRLLEHRGGAAVTALLWGLHPMRIESVAWVSERKDCLSGFFVLLTVLLYLRAVERQRFPWVALGTFVLALQSKSIAVMVAPYVILLDWAVLHRRAYREKVPFVLLSAGGAAIAFWAMTHGVAQIGSFLPWKVVGLGPRLLQVAYSEVYYARSILWPSRLSYLIEYTWMPSLEQIQYPLSIATLALVAVLLLITRQRWLTAAVLAYAVTALPQAGLFQNGSQLVANRYSYLASVPLILLAGALVVWLSRRQPRLAWSTAAVAIALLATVTTMVLPAWRNDGTLQAYGAEAEPTCTHCQDWAAVYAYQRGDLNAARRYLERAIAVSATTSMPRWERHWNLASILEQMGQQEAAATEFRLYLERVPTKWWHEPYEQVHIQDAVARLERLAARQ